MAGNEEYKKAPYLLPLVKPIPRLDARRDRNQIRNLLAGWGMTQTQLAHMTGLSLPTVKRMLADDDYRIPAWLDLIMELLVAKPSVRLRYRGKSRRGRKMRTDPNAAPEPVPARHSPAYYWQPGTPPNPGVYTTPLGSQWAQAVFLGDEGDVFVETIVALKGESASQAAEAWCQETEMPVTSLVAASFDLSEIEQARMRAATRTE